MLQHLTLFVPALLSALSHASFGHILQLRSYQAVSSESWSGCLSLLLNIIWILGGGLAMALAHLTFGVILCLTIIGIPFGLQHFKLIEVSLMPFGKRIISRN